MTITVITYYITFLYCDIHHHIFFILSFTSSEEKKNQLSFIFLPTTKSYKLVQKKKIFHTKKRMQRKNIICCCKKQRSRFRGHYLQSSLSKIFPRTNHERFAGSRVVGSGEIICNHPSVKSLLTDHERVAAKSLDHSCFFKSFELMKVP